MLPVRAVSLVAACVLLGVVGCTLPTADSGGPGPGAATSSRDATAAPAPSVPSAVPGQRVTITRWVDGDTVDTTAGRVRLLGIDTPEHGDCGFAIAGARAEQIAPVGSTAVLVAAPDDDDTDRYGRLLRYVVVDGVDVGLHLIELGVAIARYDSRDGYGPHPRESAYIAADEASPSVC